MAVRLAKWGVLVDTAELSFGVDHHDEGRRLVEGWVAELEAERQRAKDEGRPRVTRVVRFFEMSWRLEADRYPYSVRLVNDAMTVRLARDQRGTGRAGGVLIELRARTLFERGWVPCCELAREIVRRFGTLTREWMTRLDLAADVFGHRVAGVQMLARDEVVSEAMRASRCVFAQNSLDGAGWSGGNFQAGSRATELWTVYDKRRQAALSEERKWWLVAAERAGLGVDEPWSRVEFKLARETIRAYGWDTGMPVDDELLEIWKTLTRRHRVVRGVEPSAPRDERGRVVGDKAECREVQEWWAVVQAPASEIPGRRKVVTRRVARDAFNAGKLLARKWVREGVPLELRKVVTTMLAGVVVGTLGAPQWWTRSGEQTRVANQAAVSPAAIAAVAGSVDLRLLRDYTTEIAPPF